MEVVIDTDADAIGELAASSADVPPSSVHVGSGRVPASQDAIPAWSLASGDAERATPVFRTRTSVQQPVESDVSLLGTPTDDYCQSLSGHSRTDLLRRLWFVERPLGGLRNRGNDCFVNAIMVVFARLYPLEHLLSTHRHRDPSTSCFLCVLKKTNG